MGPTGPIQRLGGPEKNYRVSPPVTVLAPALANYEKHPSYLLSDIRHVLLQVISF